MQETAARSMHKSFDTPDDGSAASSFLGTRWDRLFHQIH